MRNHSHNCTPINFRLADDTGFHATIKTNEPGTANESPADVELHAYEPPSNYYAGNRESYSAPAKSSYGQQSSYSAPQTSSYGSSNSYSSPPASSYSAPPQASYSQAPRASYSAPAQRSSYSSKQQSGYSQAPRAQSYEPAAQYSSSVIVPVYQKASSAPAKATSAVQAAPAVAAAKRY